MADEQVVVGSPEREIHVQALVHLEKVDLLKQEENEEEHFQIRAKLYRYFTDEKDGSMWKERGVGEMKIMKHKSKGTYRIVMRRDKTLKLCANHALTSDMEIKNHMGNEKALLWSTPSDYADGEPKSEMLCARFGKPENATAFKEKFEECVRSMKNTDTLSSDKLADDLSSLNVKEEKDNNDNTTEKPKENGEPTDEEPKTNGTTTTKDDKDVSNDTDSSEKPKD